MPIKEFCDGMTMSGSKVETWTKQGADITNVVVGKCVAMEKHPDADTLWVCQIDVGKDAPVQIVTSAQNVFVGAFVPAALNNATCYNHKDMSYMKIKKGKLRGVPSEGMMCSYEELNLDQSDVPYSSNEGILILNDDPDFDKMFVGEDIHDALGFNDTTVEFEITNNRPDCLSVIGLAREASATFKRPLKLHTPEPHGCGGSIADLVDIDIEDGDLCPRYTARMVKNVKIAPSPRWMRERLRNSGVRPINNIVDITNYVMLEYGQPMHAFDSRKVEKIRIRRFPESFPFQTLDKVERTIDPNTLMICNGDKPVAIAGIMGGLDSEIVDDTTSLTLESATFDAASVRKSSVRLAHRTDASARYEKSLDPEMTTVAIARFVKLLQEYDPEMRVTSRLTDEYAFHYPKVQLSFDKAFVDRYTGINISSDEIMHTLTALGFGMTQDGDSFTADVPSWRATKDVTIKADIIEEITRIYGYDNFDLHTAESPLYPVRMSTEKTVEDKLKDILVKRYSLHEVHSYIWQYADDYKKLGIAVEDNVKLLNASNPNIETLRRSMIPTQLCQVKGNTGYAPSFGIFEIGHVVDGVDENKLAKEHKKLCVTLFSKVDNVETLYFRLRDMLCVAVSDILHKDLSFHAMTATHSYEHPKNLNAIVLDGVDLGEIGVAHPVVGKNIDKKAAIVFAEIDTEALASIAPAPIVYREPSRFPGMEQDLTFVVNRCQPILDAVKAENSPLVQKVTVLGTYSDITGKTITIRLSFSHPERTLTRDEVQAVVDGVVARLKGQGIELKK